MIENIEFYEFSKKKKKEKMIHFERKKKLYDSKMYVHSMHDLKTNTESVLRINRMSICKIILER